MIMSSKAITALNKLEPARRVEVMRSIAELERFSEAMAREATQAVISTYRARVQLRAAA